MLAPGPIIRVFTVVHLRSIGGAYTSQPFSRLHCEPFLETIELVTAFMKAKSCEINQGDYTEHSPLLRAAKNGHDRVVKLLLGRREYAADVGGS